MFFGCFIINDSIFQKQKSSHYNPIQPCYQTKQKRLFSHLVWSRSHRWAINEQKHTPITHANKQTNKHYVQ